MIKIKYFNFPVFLYILCTLLVFINVAIKINKYDIDNDDKFWGLSCFIINISLLLYLNYYNNYLISFIVVLLLIAFFFVYLLILKEKTGKYFILSIPFFVFLLFIFSYLLDYYTTLNFLIYLQIL